jgi:predicted acetyltransferase
MATEIRPMTTEEVPAYVELIHGSYPGTDLETPQQKAALTERFTSRMGEMVPVGVFEGGGMIGGMIQYPFVMNWRGVLLQAGGIGMVATGLMHRKEHVARDLVRYFIESERERGALFALLYPFSPEFYRRMGFAFGARRMQYELMPAQLPAIGDRRRCRPLTEADIEPLRDHCRRLVLARHGMLMKREYELKAMVSGEPRIVGVYEGERLTGFLRYHFGKEIGGNFLIYDLNVNEFSYETNLAFGSLVAFLHSLGDQVRRVRISTDDPEFYQIAEDPRDASGILFNVVHHKIDIGGVGLMVRWTGAHLPEETLEQAKFGSGKAVVALEVEDTLVSTRITTTCIAFDHGKAHRTDLQPSAVRVQLGVADYSALLMGSVSLASLARFGRASIAPESELEHISHIFRTEAPPFCTTDF